MNEKDTMENHNHFKDDCPAQCDKRHCVVCPFRVITSKKTQERLIRVSSPEYSY